MMCFAFFFLSIRRPPGSTLFPVATLSRSIIKELLTTDINADHMNRLGWTALLEAIILGRGSPRHVEVVRPLLAAGAKDRKSTRLNSSHANISYAVFCLKKIIRRRLFPSYM